ncbi:MAG: tetratricopeptide repeat protein [Vicinamibacterales bacterium]
MSNLLMFSVAASAGQKPEVQRLFQSGSFDEAAQAAENGDPATLYVAAQAMVKGEQPDRAREQFSRLRNSDNQGWRLVAESGEAMLANDSGRAVQLARQATEAAGDNPFAFYQLGLAASKSSDWGTATSAFGRALELKPDFAYAHYYSALAHQRQRQLSQAAEHFSAFLRLAPEAPERQAVQAIMRTLK